LKRRPWGYPARWHDERPPSLPTSLPRAGERSTTTQIRPFHQTCSQAGLALPLWSRDQTEVVGSLAIAGPQQRLNEESVPRLLEALREASRRLEEVVGFGR